MPCSGCRVAGPSLPSLPSVPRGCRGTGEGQLLQGHVSCAISSSQLSWPGSPRTQEPQTKTPTKPAPEGNGTKPSCSPRTRMKPKPLGPCWTCLTPRERAGGVFLGSQPGLPPALAVCSPSIPQEAGTRLILGGETCSPGTGGSQPLLGLCCPCAQHPPTFPDSLLPLPVLCTCLGLPAMQQLPKPSPRNQIPPLLLPFLLILPVKAIPPFPGNTHQQFPPFHLKSSPRRSR